MELDPEKVGDLLSSEHIARPITPENFEKYGKHNDKLVVHFWATWNGYDRQMAAVLSNVNDRLHGWIDLRSCDVDAPDNVLWAKSLGIRTVPTVVVFVNGLVRRMLIGMVDEKTLTHEILSALSQG